MIAGVVGFWIFKNISSKNDALAKYKTSYEQYQQKYNEVNSKISACNNALSYGAKLSPYKSSTFGAYCKKLGLDDDLVLNIRLTNSYSNAKSYINTKLTSYNKQLTEYYEKMIDLKNKIATLGTK